MALVRRGREGAPGPCHDGAVGAADLTSFGALSRMGRGRSADPNLMLLQFDPGDGTHTEIELGASNPRVVVGRLDECQIQTANRTVSRRHCEFVWDGGQVQLRDLGSTSGTYVNGSKVSSATLDPGDRIECGQLRITLSGGAAQPDAGHATGASGRVGDLDSFFSDGPPASAGPPAADDDLWRVADDKKAPARGQGQVPSDDDDIWKVDEPASRRATAVPADAPAPTPTPAAERSAEPGVQAPKVTGYELVYMDAGIGEGRFQIAAGARPVILGRHKDATIRVKNPTVSRRHVRILWDDGRLKVLDQGSSAGTFLNGKRIKEGHASGGDLIVCGKLEVRVIAMESQATAATEGRWTICYQDVEGNVYRHPVGHGHPPVVLGRSQVADIRLRDGTVGRKHCRVAWEDGELIATDLDSRNGTFINGERVRQRALAPGDELKCGSYPVRVEGPGSTPEDAAYAEWGDEWDADEEMSAPGWFLLYTDDSGHISYESLGPRYRVLAIGSSPDCEIHSDDRGAESDHAEVAWDEGILVVKDLQTEIGTYVNDRLVEEEEILRNGDVIACGELYVHAVRGTPGSTRERTAGHRTQMADDWAAWVRAHDSSFCLVFSQPAAHGGREELTIWGDGEARVEIAAGDERTSFGATAAESTVDLICGALLRAGFPNVAADKLDEDEVPPELVVFQGDEQLAIVLGKRTLSKSEEYRHATELLRTVLVQIA